MPDPMTEAEALKALRVAHDWRDACVGAILRGGHLGQVGAERLPEALTEVTRCRAALDEAQAQKENERG